MTPFLSIIVPVYNCAQYLEECVESILAQKFADFECILVDDGSKDESGAMCDSYQQKDNRIRVIHKQNGGLVSARKAGIEEARGTFIGYVDADDFIYPEMYADMCEKAQNGDADVVICDIITYVNGEVIKPAKSYLWNGLYEKEQLIREIYPRMLYAGDYFEFGLHPSLCDKIIRKDILYSHQMKVDEQIKIGEDAVCSYFCLLDAEKVWVLQDAYYYYRMNENSMTHKKDVTRVEKTLLELEFFWKRIKEFHAEVLKEQFCYYTAYMLTNIIYDNLRLKEYKTRKTEIYQEYEAMCNSEVGQLLLQRQKELKLPQQIRKYIRHMERRNQLSYTYAEMGRIVAGITRRISEKLNKLLRYPK